MTRTDPDTPNGPILIELDADAPKASPAKAPPVPEPDARPLPQGQAMATMAALASRRPSRLARWFLSLLGALISAWISVAIWRFVEGMVAANPILGWAMTALVGAVALLGLGLVVKELAVLRRLSRIDAVNSAATRARAEGDLKAARGVLDKLVALYSGREECRWGVQTVAERRDDVLDAGALLDLGERALLEPLDQAAREEIALAARQVATVTALVPLAFADVITALSANLRMIRRIAEIYGGRTGTLGSWRLARAVLAHLVATGLVSAGDDLLEPLLGGGLLGKLSRRFGEGLVNGALTARVGVAAMTLCRPLPFETLPKPAARSIVRSALGGLFQGEPGKAATGE